MLPNVLGKTLNYNLRRGPSVAPQACRSWPSVNMLGRRLQPKVSRRGSRYSAGGKTPPNRWALGEGTVATAFGVGARLC